MKNESKHTDASNNPHLTAETARDELIDLGLREIAGTTSPPDLTQRIIAVATQSASCQGEQSASALRESAEHQVSPPGRGRGYAREVLCASVLLVTAIGGYFLGGGAQSLVAWQTSRANDRAGEQLLPSEYYALDDVGYRPGTSTGNSSTGSEFSLEQSRLELAKLEKRNEQLREQMRDSGQYLNPFRRTDDYLPKQYSDSRGDSEGDRSGGGGTGGGQLGNLAGNDASTPFQVFGRPGSQPQNGVPDEYGVLGGTDLPAGTLFESLEAQVPLQLTREAEERVVVQLLAEGRFANDKIAAEAYVQRVKQLLAQQQEQLSGDRYRAIQENRFLDVLQSPLSTFSIDVDTASYAKSRRMILQQGVLPPPEAVRIEEFVNYFDYDYPRPLGKDAAPFAVNTELAACPWQPGHHLLRVALAGKQIEAFARPKSNLVFLLDVSGSMDSPDKLPLVKDGMRQLVERLNENDRVAIVVYAGASGLALPSTNGAEKAKILGVIDELRPNGSTNGAAGIELAYQLAEENFIADGVNRVILCTDGDFNVSVTSDGGLVRLVEEKAKSGVFITALGFGIGNHNDSMLEQIADRGNGNYGYVDSRNESYKLFAQQMSGTLVTIAKDVKIQVEFNPAHVASYRLVGYENRMLATEDFADDSKDAGEIGAGHTVTALYELIPAGGSVEPTPGLKYQRTTELTAAAQGSEFANVALRYKEPDGDVSKLLEMSVSDPRATIAPAGNESGDDVAAPEYGPMPVGTDEFQFAAAVASFAMILRNSAYQGETSFDAVLEMARGAGPDEFGYRAEFLQIVEAARQIALANQPQPADDVEGGQ